MTREWRVVSELTFSRVAEVEPPLVTVCVRDITEGRRAAEALRRSAERFRTIIETSREMVSIMSSDGTFLYVSSAIRPVLGVAFLQAIAEGAQTSFLGLWALRSLGASQTELGFAFAAAAIAAIAAGYLAGKLSDRIGRRRPILVASAALVVFVIVCQLLGMGENSRTTSPSI